MPEESGQICRALRAGVNAMQPDDPILDLLNFDDAVVFAVVDGAMMDDLRKVLRSYQLDAQALYFDHQSQIANSNGPHLIHCADESEIVTVRAAFQPDGVVWWVWSEPDASHAKAAIFRHLRGLGMVEIPANYPNPSNPRAPMERVLFRHADARVMARVLPVLEPAQRARLFGRAGAIVLQQGGQLRRALVPADLPMAPPGFLRLSRAQMDQIAEVGKQESHQRILAYLRRTMPPEFASASDDQMNELIELSDTTGRNLGLKSEKAHARWAYLMLLSRGQIAEALEVQDALRNAADPDARVKALMSETAEALRNGGAA